MLTKFTLRIYEDIYNKVYEDNVLRLSYWVVPVLACQTAQQQSCADLEQILDMEQIRRVCNEPTWQWTPDTDSEQLVDRYFVDPLNGGRRYYSNCLAPHLKPQDPVPAHIPRQNHKFMKSILDYTDSRWSKTRDISRWDQSQPVLEVEKIPFRRNHLARVEDKEQRELSDLTACICPQPLRISNVSDFEPF